MLSVISLIVTFTKVESVFTTIVDIHPIFSNMLVNLCEGTFLPQLLVSDLVSHNGLITVLLLYLFGNAHLPIFPIF